MVENTLLSIEAAAAEGLRRLIEHEEKILTLLPNLYGRPMTIRSDTWEIRIHDTEQATYDYMRDAMSEAKGELDFFLHVIGQSIDPSLEKMWDGEGSEPAMENRVTVGWHRGPLN